MSRSWFFVKRVVAQKHERSYYDYFQKEVNPYHNMVLLEMSVMATRNPRLRRVLMQHRVNQHAQPYTVPSVDNKLQ